MSLSFKKLLLAGTALAAIGGAASAHAETVIVDSFAVGVSSDPNANPAISIVSGGTWASIDDGVNITGNTVTYQDGVGNIAVQGNSTFNGNIGASGKSVALIWSGISPTATDTYNGDVFATTIALDAGTSIFNKSVASSLYFANAGNVTFNGTVTGGMDYAQKNGNVTLGDGSVFNGDINSGAIAGSGIGTLTLAGSATLNGDASFQDDGLATLQGGDNGSKSTITGNVNAETVAITGTGSMTFGGKLLSRDIIFSGNGALTLTYGNVMTGDVSSSSGVAGAGIGTLIFDGADGSSTTFNGNVLGGLKALTLAGSDEALLIDGDFYAADAVNLNGNTLTVAGVFELADGQSVNTTLTDSGKGTIIGGSIIGLDAVTVASGAGVHIDASGIAGKAKVGDIFTVIDGSNAGAGAVAQLDAGNISSGLLFTFTQTSDNDSLIVELTDIKSVSDIATAGNNAAVGAAIEASCASSGDACHALYTGLLNAGTTQEFNSLLESAQPANLNGAAVTSMIDAGTAIFGVTETKLAAARGGAGSGMAAGYAPSGSSVWAQGYGQTADQGMRGGVAGYQSDLLGFAAGVELPTTSAGNTLGIALNYANTDVDSRNANTTATDIDSYGVTLYGTHAFACGAFVDGQVGYAYNDIHTVRHNAGGAGLVAIGDFSSDQYAARLRAGKDYAQKGGLYLTPSVMASYTALKTDGYTETGTGTLLSVNDENFDILKMGVGLQAEWRFKNASGEKLKPSLHANYAYNVTGDNVETSASFAAGGTAFKTTGADPARSEFNVGAGLTYTTQANFDLTGIYDYTYKQDFASHAGLLRGTVHF